MPGVVYDAGALIAAERNDRRMWALHKAAHIARIVPIVPAPVLAQVWRGGAQQASLGRLLRGCDSIGLTPTDAKPLGAILARAGTSDVIDAHLVLVAMRTNATVITSDPHDIAHLATTLNTELAITTI